MRLYFLFFSFTPSLVAALSRIKDGGNTDRSGNSFSKRSHTATAGRSNGAESREFEFIKIKASLVGVGLGAALMRPMMFPMEPGERVARDR